MTTPGALPEILAHSPVEVVFGAGTLEQVGPRAARHGAGRVLLVTDAGIVAAGHAERARRSLESAGLHVTLFDRVVENPTTAQVADGLSAARDARVDFFVGLGGGSAMDCAKGVNLLLTNGGAMRDYWGVNKATAPLLPMIAIPTTAGTGSEAQSFALISDAETHVKMACGDRRLPAEGGLRPRVAILDPELTRTQPPRVAAAAAIDAVSHAIETAGCRVRTELSRSFSHEAWGCLSTNVLRALRDPDEDEARAATLLGAHLAGAAIENAMLGAAHALANPLTARFGVVHGVAVGLMLPHVIRFNAAAGDNPYADLDADADRLAATVIEMLTGAGLPRRLKDCGVDVAAIPTLAEAAAEQWTAGFNPRPVDAPALAALYEAAV